MSAKFPQLPKGVFDFTRENQEDVLTWQPRKAVRIAMVIEFIQSSNIGFIAAGRSLQEVEKRESNLTLMVVIGWMVCTGIIILNGIIGSFRKEKLNG